MTLLNSVFDHTARHDAEGKRDLVPASGLTVYPGDVVRLQAAASVPYTVERFDAPLIADPAANVDHTHPAQVSKYWVIIQGNSTYEYNPTGKVVGVSSDIKITTDRFTGVLAVGDQLTIDDHADYSWKINTGGYQVFGIVTRAWTKEGTAVVDIELV